MSYRLSRGPVQQWLSSRRGVLGAALGFLVLTTTGSVTHRLAADDVKEHPLARQGRRLRALLVHPDSAARIAAAYLAQSAEKDPLQAALTLGMADVLLQAPATDGQVELQGWLSEVIRADFANGATIMVHGWCLARTEVGACLLAVV